jgi:hypothetical protein
MKWRLLEGGGQAYYELGVADSGALVGLPRAELDLSLETLDRMAGEIGASVIVVKEIEVPAAVAGIVGSETDRWNSRRRHRKTSPLSDASEENSSSGPENEDTSSSRDTDSDKFYPNNLSFLYAPSFLEPVGTVEGDNVELEIASVFKPRSSHNHLCVPSRNSFKQRDNLPNNVPDSCKDSVIRIPTKQEAKAVFRRSARDRKRCTKRGISSIHEAASSRHSPIQTSACNESTSDLSAISFSPGSPSSPPNGSPASELPSSGDPSLLQIGLIPPLRLEEEEMNINYNDIGELNSIPSIAPLSKPPEEVATRYIVEALVLRKMSFEEAFLDFGNFSLS